MTKLYKNTPETKQYWEAWDNDDGSYTVHWGALGTRGESKVVQGHLFHRAETLVDKEKQQAINSGFKPIEEFKVLLIEFSVDGFGDENDLQKRYNLQDRMDETLGWTGLGHCDGGSVGSGTMEVCCLVVDFELAQKVIIEDLVDTEFSNYSRIFLEQWPYACTV